MWNYVAAVIVVAMWSAITVAALRSSPDATPSSFALTALDDYVAMDDGCFRVVDLNRSFSGLGWTAHMWNLTSQCWLTPADSDRPTWWHLMAIVVPWFVNTSSTSGLLWITGETNVDTFMPTATDPDIEIMSGMAVETETIGAVLYQVPNQPVNFPWDPWHVSNRVEDSAISVTWWHFLQNTSAPDFILEFPMTKAGVRALDAMELIVPQYASHTPTDFYVLGASKRGWTTWLVGAVEAAGKNRVKGIMPVVLDALNFVEFLHRQFRSYGAWTFALADYLHANITQALDTPAMHALVSLIDPFFYRDRLTMPKFAVNAVGDEFQMPDDHRYWVHEMVGEMNTLMIKNAEHSLITGMQEVMQAGGAYLKALVVNQARPNYTWTIDNATGRITVTTSETPLSVSVVYAYSAAGVSVGRRDFRWGALGITPCTIPVFGGCLRAELWKSQNVTRISDTTFTALLDVPTDGWVAFFIELQFSNPVGLLPFLFTSATSVLPDTRLFEDCAGTGCRGWLV